MRLNSFIQVEFTTPSGKNEYGASIGATAEWSDPILCHIMTVRDNRLGKYEDGVFHQASYQVYVEPTIENILPFGEAKRVKLTRRATELGEFSIQSIERIETQNRLKILV